MIHILKCFEVGCREEIGIETEKPQLCRAWCAEHATWLEPRRPMAIEYYDWSVHDKETQAMGDPESQDQLSLL